LAAWDKSVPAVPVPEPLLSMYPFINFPSDVPGTVVAIAHVFGEPHHSVRFGLTAAPELSKSGVGPLTYAPLFGIAVLPSVLVVRFQCDCANAPAISLSPKVDAPSPAARPPTKLRPIDWP
jgi:hypothetical protein